MGLFRNFRASVRYTAQRQTNWNQDYVLTWNMLPGLRVNAQLFQIDTDNVRTTFRRSASLIWDLGSRSGFYFRVAEVDFGGLGGTTTESFQQGFRITF